MADLSGEIAENCGFEGKILCEVPQPCAPCDSRDTCDTTTSEQLAEIEGQATEYTAPEGWRVLEVGELLQPGDQVVQLHDGKRYPTERAGQYVCETQRYIRPIEPQPEPQLEPQPEPQPEPEPVPQDADQMIRLLSEANHSHVAMIGRLQAAINERAELGGADQTRAELQARIRGLEIMTDTHAETIARLQSEAHELNMEIGGLQGDLSRRQARIRDLETLHAAASQAVVRADKANDKLRAQADELRSEVSYVQRLLGESRQRVTHLEELVTSLRNINEAQEKAFTAAGKQNTTLREQLDAATAELQKRHPDHVGRAISTDEWMDQFARDASVSRLQADRNDLAGKVIVLREQLQQANDRLAQLEVLQPIAAACHTAQTMVRDMLGHMRCLLALQHTTDRRDFCTLLESILEVFDEAECDEDEDEDTTSTTTEAKQG